MSYSASEKLIVAAEIAKEARDAFLDASSADFWVARCF
jgi:hypothetical protein